MPTLKGLDPKDYDGSRWQGRLLKLDQKPSEEDLGSFDTALTVSAMRYIRAIHCGRVNPKEFKFQLDMEGKQLPLAEFIHTQVVNAGDAAAEIQKLEPVDTENSVRIENAGFRSVREIIIVSTMTPFFIALLGSGHLYLSDPCRSAG